MCKHLKLLLVSLVLALHVLTACSTIKLPDVQVRDANQYKIYQEQKGVRVAVDPYLEEERLMEFFGADLLIAFGLLPIHVVIENSVNQPLLVQKENIAILTSENEAIMQEPVAYAKMPIEQKRREGEQAAMYIGAMIGIAPLLAIPAVLAAPATMKASTDYQTIMQNLSEKALYDKSIYNGEQHNGFVYFLLKDNVPKGIVPKVRVKVKNLKTEEALSFSFDLDLSSVKRKAAEAINEP